MAIYNQSNFPPKLKTNDVVNFNYTGSYKVITLQPGQYIFECYGGSGGNRITNSAVNGYGANGGYTYGILQLTKVKTFYVYTGGAGSRGYGATGGAGGYNGGGSGGNDGGSGADDVGGGGGGASDIRVDSTGTLNRVMVAGGGGGNLTYGYGGEIYGGSTAKGRTATQTGGYSFGSGQAGQYGGEGWVGTGGGGGGYYGGYSEAVGGSSTYNGTYGGGGSSFISGMYGCDARNSSGAHTGQPNHFSGIVFTNGYTSGGYNNGNGLVVITVLKLYRQWFINTNEPKYIQNNILYGFGRIPQTITSSDYDNYGMTEYLFDQNNPIVQNKKYDFYFRNDTSKLNYSFVPQDQLIVNINNITLRNNLIVSNVNITGNSLKCVIHNGYYWYTLINNSWVKIDSLNAYYVGNNGLTPTQLNNISFDKWKELYSVYDIPTPRKINLAVVLIQNEFNSAPYINKIAITTNIINQRKKVHENLYNVVQDYDSYLITWNTGNKTKVEIIYK